MDQKSEQAIALEKYAKELMRKIADMSKEPGFLQSVVQTCDIELLQVVLLAFPEKKPINFKNHFDINPLCCFSRTFNVEAEKLKMVQFLMPYISNPGPSCYSLKEFFPALLAHGAFQNFLVIEFLIHKLYCEDNSLYPLIKKLEAAVEESHFICILLHDDIDSVMDLLTCEEFDRLGHFDFVYFGKIVKIFTKLLAKDTHESSATAVETFQVLMDKQFCEFAEDNLATTVNYFFEDHEIRFENPPNQMFHFVYNSITSKTQKKIFDLISEWIEVCLSVAMEGVKTLNQTKEFLSPFISKPLDRKLQESARRKIVLTDKGNVHSLQECCRDAIRCKIFEQMDDVKEFMHRIWMLQLPRSVKCFLLYIPDPSWINNLQLS